MDELGKPKACETRYGSSGSSHQHEGLFRTSHWSTQDGSSGYHGFTFGSSSTGASSRSKSLAFKRSFFPTLFSSLLHPLHVDMCCYIFQSLEKMVTGNLPKGQGGKKKEKRKKLIFFHDYLSLNFHLTMNLHVLVIQCLNVELIHTCTCNMISFMFFNLY